MQHVPVNAHQTTVWPVSLQNLPGCRSISDDDLCAWCSHLFYRPGELSVCQQVDADGHWPSDCDADGYTHSCPQLQLNVSPAGNTAYLFPQITQLTHPAQQECAYDLYKRNH